MSGDVGAEVSRSGHSVPDVNNEKRDVGAEVAAVLAEITDPIHAGGCYYRHQQGEVDECNSCTAHRIETQSIDALAPLIAVRVEAAKAEARREVETAVLDLCNKATTSANEFGKRTFVLDVDEFRAALNVESESTCSRNHATLHDGILLDPGYCAGCDEKRAAALDPGPRP